MSEWLKPIEWWVAQHAQWLGLAIFITAFLECLALVGLFVPGAILLGTLALIAGKGALSLEWTVAFAFAGGLLGDITSYALGYRYQNRIRQWQWVKNHTQWLTRSEIYFQSYGAVSLLIGRFIGPIRPILPMVAGMMHMPWWIFLGVSVLASAAWSLTFMLPIWATGAAMDTDLPAHFWSESALLLVPLVLLLLGLSQSLLREKKWLQWLAPLLLTIYGCGIFMAWHLVSDFDLGLSQLIKTHRNDLLNRLAVLTTQLGNSTALIGVSVILVGYLLWHRAWRHAIFIAVVQLSSAGIGWLLKISIERTRPEQMIDHLHSFSMPSAHASGTFALMIGMALLMGRQQPPAWRLAWLAVAAIPAVMVALSRIYLGAHWPTDVLAGAILACAINAWVLWMLSCDRPLTAPMKGTIWPFFLMACLFMLFYVAWSHESAWAFYRLG